jgi:hypothetical protein
VSSNDSVGIKLATFPSSAGSFTRLIDRRSGEVSRPQKVALRKISKSDRHQMPSATKAHERVFPLGSCNGFVLCGIPYRGWMRLTLALRPTNRLPTSPLGAGHKGHREAPLLHLQLFKSSTGHPSLQLANRLVLSTFRDFLRIATTRPSRNSIRLWKGPNPVGKPLSPASNQPQIAARGRDSFASKLPVYRKNLYSREKRREQRPSGPHSQIWVPHSKPRFLRFRVGLNQATASQ